MCNNHFCPLLLIVKGREGIIVQFSQLLIVEGLKELIWAWWAREFLSAVGPEGLSVDRQQPE